METQRKKQTERDMENVFTMTSGGFVIVVQLNEYETAPYFNQFSQNLTFDCLLISVFSPEFPKIYLS